MRYIDPLPITCPRCLAKSVQRVAAMLRRRANCPTCGTPLDDIGQEMRAGYDDWGAFCTAAEIASRLGEMLGVTISDAELDGSRTLRDIARALQRHLPPSSDCESLSIAHVREAAKGLAWCSVTDPALDIPLMDAVDPDRWKRVNG